MSGITWIVSYVGYFLGLADMESADVFNTSAGIIGIMLVGNVFGWFLVERRGRRGTAFCGMPVIIGSSQLTSFFLIKNRLCSPYSFAIYDRYCSVIKVNAAVWVQVAFMCVWAFTYQATIGAVAWPIISQVPTSTVRAATHHFA